MAARRHMYGLRSQQTVRFRNELERNITIKLGYANAKIFKAVEGAVPGPGNFRLVLQ